MDLRTYVRALRKSIPLIILTTLIGLGLGYAAYATTTKSYTSTVDFYVSTHVSNTTNAQAAAQFGQARIVSYVQLLSTDELGQRVVDDTHVDLTPHQVTHHIAGTYPTNSVIISATVTDTTPKRAQLIARGVADEYPKLISELDNGTTHIVDARVVSGPTTSNVPVSPRRNVRLILGALVGLLVGIGLALLRQMLDKSVHDQGEVEEIVQAPVIGSIPGDDKQMSTLALTQPTSPRAEAYRQLRTNLGFLDAANPARSIVVTAPNLEQGSSQTALNVAHSFAEIGQRTCLVEADLRHPSVASALGVSADTGLSNVLAHQASLDDALVETELPRLTVLPAGSLPPNPSDLMATTQMQDVVRALSERFDRVVFDAPPVLPYDDARVLSTLTDGVVIVANTGRTARTSLQRTATSLRVVNAKILGVVMAATRGRGSRARS